MTTKTAAQIATDAVAETHRHIVGFLTAPTLAAIVADLLEAQEGSLSPVPGDVLDFSQAAAVTHRSLDPEARPERPPTAICSELFADLSTATRDRLYHDLCHRAAPSPAGAAMLNILRQAQKNRPPLSRPADAEPAELEPAADPLSIVEITIDRGEMSGRWHAHATLRNGGDIRFDVDIPADAAAADAAAKLLDQIGVPPAAAKHLLPCWSFCSDSATAILPPEAIEKLPLWQIIADALAAPTTPAELKEAAAALEKLAAR